MSLDDFEIILKQVKPLAKEVCLHLMGEPLAHPKFLEILDICEKHKVLVQLTSNGLLINKYHQELLKRAFIRQINFSLQAFKDNFPNRPLKSYLEPILNFVQKSHIDRPDLYINFRMWNQSSEQEDNSDILNFIENFFNIKVNPNIEVGAIKSKRVWNKLYLHFDSRFEWPTLESPFQGTQGKCHGLIRHIGIHADGTVVPCCLDDKGIINLGNCLSTPLSEILDTERANRMREGFLNGVLVENLCQRCQFITRFSK